MKSHMSLHQQDTEASRRRSGHRMSMGSSLPLPRIQSRIATARANQPAFDFMTGAERPPSRDRFRASSIARPPSAQGHHDPNHETEQEREKRKKELDDAKAEVKTLKYSLDNHKQEEQLATLRHESELREARRKAEEDFRKMQVAEAERSKAMRQYEALLKEFNDAKDSSNNGKSTLERQLREYEESKRQLQEEFDDFKYEKEDIIRSLERKAAELATRNETLHQSVGDLQQDSDRREALLQETQQQLAAREASVGTLEGDLLKLKSQVGDVEAAQQVKKEMHEQLNHVRKLEETCRVQAVELKHLKQLHKAVEVVEEEKRSLQRKLDSKESLEAELGEAIIQRQRLEDERLTWTAYLQSQEVSNGQLEFGSPEELARAFVAEQIQIATLTERIGAIEAESAEKDNTIQTLEADKARLKQVIDQHKTVTTAPVTASSTSTSTSQAKLVQRLERQKALANKEVAYLRDQLKVYDSEDATFQADQLDEAKQKRIQELEDVVEQYRTEVQTLTSEITSLSSVESSTSQTSTASQPDPQPGSKRPLSASSTVEESEQLGQLLRKNRKLQDEYTNLKSSHKLLEKELAVSKERLSAATKESKTRVLSLRSNPTSDFEAIKLSTLKALRQENEDLLAQIQNNFQATGNIAATIPLSTLSAAEHKIAELRTQLQSQTTRNDRLLKTWGTKTAEFRQSIVDLLGWDVQFLKDGKMKVTSRYYPATEDAENSILFDGVRGSMKVSGGPESAFAGRIGDQIKFWVKGKSCVPGLLAALTMEFWEEANKDGTVMVDV